MPEALAEPSTAMRYVLPAVALKVSLLVLLGPELSSLATAVSEPTAVPV